MTARPVVDCAAVAEDRLSDVPARFLRRLRAVPDAAEAFEREVVSLREAGWLLVEIANRFAISGERVTRIIERAGGVDRERWLAARRDLQLERARERSGEIRERYRTGEDPQATGRELGLDQRAVKRVIKQARTDADLRARERAIAARQQPRFSDAELLDGLRRVAHRLGGAPTARKYDRLAAQLALASSWTLSQRFDGWRSALHAAGLIKAPPRMRRPRWDADACWRALESVANELGDPPRYRRYLELARQRNDLPSATIVRQRLGTWSQIAARLHERQGSDTTHASERAAA